ncbi:MarR family winged helix-turn-helix transcriptional regulator [Beijerinckia sp. L45]|uniref:MarR family winged helix-turn-helix transcriptional regulator n=1 Tax=Beijerinckia sp. L45 TaxID=1641855 RepID=UPI001AEE1FE2|nr:MarR family transcriptional regulator [Beijerinckia sp. L45]
MSSVFSLSICNNAATKRAARRLGQFYDDVLAPGKLRATQYALMDQVERLGTPSMTDLASALVLDRSALSHTLRPLERDAFVAFLPGLNDRRVKRVELTVEGRRRLEICRALWQSAQTQFEATFGIEEAAALRRTLDLLASPEFRLPAGSRG